MSYDLREIERRFNKLERSNRTLKLMLSVCLLGAAVMMLMGAASPTPKVIDAEKIVLHDSAGNERGELFASENAWGLVLFNKNNTRAASLVVSAGLNGVLLCDQNGNVRESITQRILSGQNGIYFIRDRTLRSLG